MNTKLDHRACYVRSGSGAVAGQRGTGVAFTPASGIDSPRRGVSVKLSFTDYLATRGYLQDLGVTEALIDYATNLEVDELKPLSVSQATALGLEVGRLE